MKILIATDGSPWSQAAIREAARLLPLAQAEVHVIAVADLGAMVATAEGSGIAAAMLEDRELDEARADADQAVAMLAELGVQATPHRREGDVAHEIVALGRALAPDVLVIGAHAKNALERLFLGSTSDAIIHRWPGAVLVVRPKDA